jgi:hypothetical protein
VRKSAQMRKKRVSPQLFLKKKKKKVLQKNIWGEVYILRICAQ